MKYKNILVTGGAGFVGSNICIKLKEHYPDINVIAFDNLYRKGSVLNLPRLEKQGVKFIKGDVRFQKDIESAGKIDLLIECSAEPAVTAGVNSSPEYLLHTNLFGAVNCFEYARQNRAAVVFLSTSRVYPYDVINNLKYEETATRYELSAENKILGLSKNGISEEFPLSGVRSMYGATKLSAEYLLLEYVRTYGMKAVIDRFGVIAGPWQMGKVDQGFVTHWLSSFVYDRPLSYFGFGGLGKQVRDIIHVDDVYELLMLQIDNIQKYSGGIYNASGGFKNSLSLLELTQMCQDLIGKKMQVYSDKSNRTNDVIYYIGDNSKINKVSGWFPQNDVKKTVSDVYKWIVNMKL